MIRRALQSFGITFAPAIAGGMPLVILSMDFGYLKFACLLFQIFCLLLFAVAILTNWMKP